MTSDGGAKPRLSPSPATDAAAALLDEFVALGLRDIVLSPGSRSQALALAAAALDRAGAITLHVRIDERVAGFTALGLARESRRPVAVVCTSGTAVANSRADRARVMAGSLTRFSGTDESNSWATSN